MKGFIIDYNVDRRSLISREENEMMSRSHIINKFPRSCPVMPHLIRESTEYDRVTGE